MATHPSVLVWRIPGTGEPGAAIYGVAQSWTQLKQLSRRAFMQEDVCVCMLGWVGVVVMGTGS